MTLTFTISSGKTWLSIIHTQWFKNLLADVFPDFRFMIVQDRWGDAGDFRIIEGNATGMATIGDRPHAFLKQGDPRNIAIFNENIEQKLGKDEAITIATVSGLQTVLIEQFLQKALPKKGNIANTIKVIHCADHLETMLESEAWDGVVVSLADLNTLLRNNTFKELIRVLLSDKKSMILPLFEVPPQPGEAALVAYANAVDDDPLAILEKLNNSAIETKVNAAYSILKTQPATATAGAFSLDTGTTTFTYAAGFNISDQSLTAWDFEIPAGLERLDLFSSTDYMRDFFTYEYLNDDRLDTAAEAVFISSHKAIHSNELSTAIATKKVWAAGTRTWYELAKKGIWVEGCADGLGLEFLESCWQSPLISLNKKNVQIITNASSAQHWLVDGWQAAGTYELVPALSKEIGEAISKAQFIFWTSFQQYEQYKDFADSNALHGCPAGKTAKLLLAAGLKPVIFPTIKAFNDWRAANEGSKIDA
ncbi:MAG: hypothetical protein ABIX01_11050 [Chitinophagaceae bacterium]